jgi:AcrR family transcriptional regulator
MVAGRSASSVLAGAAPAEEKPSSTLDGRHLRSERTRTAIVDALLVLLEEGDPQPPAERVAERAGVSRRALFHHFRDVEDLLAAAADRQLSRVLPTLRPISPDGPLASRLTAYAAQICALHARIAPVRRAALLAERSSPTVAERLRRARAMHRASIEAIFGAELAELPRRDEALAAVVAATSFLVWEELVTHQCLSLAAAERVVRRSLEALVTLPYPPPQAINSPGRAGRQ